MPRMSPDTPFLRLFFALWPAPAEQAALAHWQQGLQAACGGRAMRPDTLHLTLAFLGAVERPHLPALQQAMGELEVPLFRLCFDTVRHWPHNRIVYAAPSSPPPALAVLASSLAERLDRARFTFDRRPFQPHVTLLRNARCAEGLPALPAPVCWTVRDFALVHSMSDAHGVRYEVLARSAAAPLE